MRPRHFLRYEGDQSKCRWPPLHILTTRTARKRNTSTGFQHPNERLHTKAFVGKDCLTV